MKEGVPLSPGKEAEDRKKEILDVAEELFATKGYDHTSTTDILDRVGIARGTLYYHFRSKEEILDALIHRVIQDMVRNIHQAVSEQRGAIPKLLSFVGAMNVDSEIGMEITDYAHRPQNALMHQKIRSALLSALTPIATDLIHRGMEEGCFSTPYPEEASEMLLVYSSVVFDDLNEMTPDSWQKKSKGFIFNMERLLGVKQGGLSEMAQFFN